MHIASQHIYIYMYMYVCVCARNAGTTTQTPQTRVISGNHGNHGHDKNHGNPGCKTRVPQTTGLHIPEWVPQTSIDFRVALLF